MYNNLKPSKIIISLISIGVFFLFLYFFNVSHPIVFKPNGDTANVNYEKAEVLDVQNNNLQKSVTMKGLYFGSQEIKAKILTGKYKGEITNVSNYLSDTHNVFLKKGMKFIANINSVNKNTYSATVYSYYRAPIQYAFIFIFFLALGIIGGRKGVKSVLGLIFTFICIIFLFLPMIYSGYSPIYASILIVIITTCITLSLLDGWSNKAISAILGTISGVIIAAIIAVIFGGLAHLSGINSNDVETLNMISTKSGMQVQGLLLASILIASLGAVLDLSMSIASAVQEIYSSNPKLSTTELFRSGMNVGKDMMGTMANTLILAFVGSSLNMIMVIYSYNVSFTQLMNMDMVSIEIIQGLTGSFAIIFTVPIIAFISSKIIPSSLLETKNATIQDKLTNGRAQADIKSLEN
ncbi:MAG: YibE/F family protein [Clostridium sp.]|uniref:YibE/F family protein n=1 Tax=Clostridium sp. TaxID=1506 RepID=UPI0039E9266F